MRLIVAFSALTLLVGWQEGHPACKIMGDCGGGHWLVWMEWCPAGWLVFLPLLIFPCTIKSRSSLLAPAHPDGPGKRAIKRLWCGGGIVHLHLAEYLTDAVSCRHHHAADDTSSEFTRFRFKVAFLSIVILHEDPTGVPQDSSEPAPTSVDRLREMADKYFDSVRRDISIVGVSTPDGLAQLRKGYSKACPLDHLGY